MITHVASLPDFFAQAQPYTMTVITFSDKSWLLTCSEKTDCVDMAQSWLQNFRRLKDTLPRDKHISS